MPFPVSQSQFLDVTTRLDHEMQGSLRWKTIRLAFFIVVIFFILTSLRRHLGRSKQVIIMKIQTPKDDKVSLRRAGEARPSMLKPLTNSSSLSNSSIQTKHVRSTFHLDLGTSIEKGESRKTTVLTTLYGNNSSVAKSTRDGIEVATQENASSTPSKTLGKKNIKYVSTSQPAISDNPRNGTYKTISIERQPKTEVLKIKLKSRFDKRNNRVREVCSRPSNLRNVIEKGRKSTIAYGGLDWCMVPKAGTTFITYNLMQTIRLKENGIKSFLDASHHKNSFFIVREPYGRLVSAYFSKVVSHPKWWVSLGWFIVNKFRKNPMEKSAKCGHDVTFPEFIKYFIYAQRVAKYKNIHFDPIHEICNPCQENTYDFIGHLETIKDDMTYILDSVNVTTNDDFRFDPVKTIVTHFMTRDERHRDCGGPWCPTFQRLWWALQSNGHIASSISMPLKDNECDSVTLPQMIQLTQKAANQSIGITDKAGQKRKAVAELYAQVGLEDRIRVRDALLLDFELFGYNSIPEFVFPPN